MDEDMWKLWFTKLLIVLALLLCSSPNHVYSRHTDDVVADDAQAISEARIKRDLQGVTTVLLVSARPGKSAPPVGLLTKTARTFVQDGASTEFATQIVGTTLDNGRLYARILSTSSRVFYDKEQSVDSSSPFVVYPSKAPQEDWQFRVALDNAPIRAIKEIEDLKDVVEDNKSTAEVEDQEGKHSEGSPSRLDELSRENDIFGKRELGNDQPRVKPAKIRPADNLPTYTVKHEYVTSGFDFEDEEPKSFRPRAPKIFKPRLVAQKKPEPSSLATVTYHGFADFTTTVGDTVIVFSPSTSPVPVGRPATTIKGDATLRPDDGIAVLNIKPTNVVPQKATQKPSIQNHEPVGTVEGSIQPSVTEELDLESSTRSTDPLLLVPEAESGSLKPTGLLRVVDSTTSLDGTTTHYKSLIYGTYLGTNYAQIIHTSSNVYFFPEEATATYGVDDTTVEYDTTATDGEEMERDTTLEMTTGTTPRTLGTSEDSLPETNELTTPFRDTTDSVLTTLKDILESARKVLETTESALPTVDDELANDIVPGDPQGRSIKGGSPQNILGDNKRASKIPTDREEKLTIATRLVPSTAYKTFTYFTTFFIPGENDQTTTSVRSREVVSSELSLATELYASTVTETPGLQGVTVTPTIVPQLRNLSIETEEEQTTKQDEEIELIFKTLYTTYTYLTTFFQESSSSISSREVIETNVVTQTVGPNGISADVVGLFNKDESVLIAPTSISDTILPTVSYEKEEEENKEEPFQGTTEETLTTIEEQETTLKDQYTTESVNDEEEEAITDIEPSPTPAITTQQIREQVKTYYTTYTYFTTIFVEDETEIETRTEVFSNVVTETIKPTAVLPAPQETSEVTTEKTSEKPAVPPEILAYLEALQRQKSQEEALLLAKKVQQESNSDEETDRTAETTAVAEESVETTTDNPTTMDDRMTTENSVRDFVVNAQVTPNPPVDGEVLGSMITDVVSSSSSGGGTVLSGMDKRNAVPEDQELSESNHHDVEPAPTLLLQTSYTTFTYFTTMYKGDSSNVVSRLETVTNIATETIRPSSVLPVETSTLPVTYYTTFTYWTTFYKGGDTVTTSREETVSNIVTPGISPSPTVQLGVVMTYTPTADKPLMVEDSPIIEEPKVTADNEVTPSDLTPAKVSTAETPILTNPSNETAVTASSILPEPTTYYTTYTYFTTSYIGNQTILNSRLETVTSVSIPEVTAQLATARSIGAPVPGVQGIVAEEKTVTPSKTSELAKTGLLSTIRSSVVQDGTTTHFATDLYGTYIDGLYAQVVESSTRLETQAPSSSTATPSLSSIATPVLPTGVLSLNKGSVIDADDVTTVYFTTKQIGTLIDGLYAKVIESTSTTKIDEEKKATVPPTQGHRTGLVRLIQGQIESNGTTTYYQSKVIGTNIDGRYAQIIESTSTFLSSTPTQNIAPSSTSPPVKPTDVPEISPSPAVIQSSLSDEPTTDPTEQDEDSEQNEEIEEGEEEDEDGQSSKKKSRLTFSTRKRTFTPVIRPFASRNRPTFNPKRKGAQGATTITRTDITPTITATLAGKGRFASSRGRVSSPIGPYSSTLSPSPSRRFSGRRGSTASPSSLSSAVPSGSSRGRPISRISPSSAFQASRRGPSSIRGSSARASPRGSSSLHPAASSRYRPGIRPSSTLLRGQSTVRHEDQEDEANEFTTTTLVTEETPYTEDAEGGETVTAPLQTTTESSRRSTNPLLRFRRPLNYNAAARASTTSRPVSSTTRRNGNLNRQTLPTIPARATSARTNNRVVPPVSTRPRQGSTGLIPPRGLFGRKQEAPVEEQEEENQEDEEEEENDESFEDDPVEEITDNDYEGSEHEDRASTSNVNRRTGKSIAPTVQIRPFAIGRGRRVRRQASQLRSLTNRFRRPTSSSSARPDENSDSADSASSKEESSKPSKPTSRYNSRARTLTTARPSSSKSSYNSDKSAESAETSSKTRVRTKQTSGSSRNASRIKASPVSSSNRQFTLREKESSSSRSTYKRPSSSSSRTNTRSDNGRVRPMRYRNSSSKTTGDSRRVSSSRTSSRSSSRNGNRKIPQRGRGSYEDIRESSVVQTDNDGTITVTHYVPREVTIPVVNNGITEQKNIITAQPSTEVIGPNQYSTVTGGDGKPLVVIVSEVTGTNNQGQMEITRFLLHETPTTRVSHTLTTLGGRRVSQSLIVPSTIYSVENVVSTVQPSLPNNAPLANILLSQLLLGQLGQQNPLLQSQGTPTTQYNTRTTSYVTTITKHQSTVIPLTFRGKEILTTLVDTSTNVVTATEFITDTVVVTPTAALPAGNLNSLLLLLQQPQAQPQQQNLQLDPLFAAAPLLTQSNTLPGEVERRHQPADSDYKPASYEYSDEDSDEGSFEKASKSRKDRPRHHDRKDDHASSKAESSVVTLYVSGRRPGEFSTILSTVRVGESASVSRRRREAGEEGSVVQASVPPSLHAGQEAIAVLAGSEEPADGHAATQSLESVVGESPAYANVRPDGDYADDQDWSNYDDPGRPADDQDTQTPRKRVRIRVPVVRGRTGKQHKFTVVRRRPLVPYARSSPIPETTLTPRRIVVTRVRPRLPSDSLNDDYRNFDSYEPETVENAQSTRHKVTITRRRKIQPATTSSAKKVRITRKKLVNVRPVQVEPTPTISIITAGFFTANSDEYDDDYSEESDAAGPASQDYSTNTPDLEETPLVILDKPEDTQIDTYTSMEIATTSINDETSDTPIIITDNFFFPASDDEEDDYGGDDVIETTTKNVEETSPEIDVNNSLTTTSPAPIVDEEPNVPAENETNVKLSPDEGSTTVPSVEVTSQDSPVEYNSTETTETTTEVPYSATSIPMDDEKSMEDAEGGINSEDPTTIPPVEEITNVSNEQEDETTTVIDTTEKSVTEIGQDENADMEETPVSEIPKEIPEEELTIRPVKSSSETESDAKLNSSEVEPTPSLATATSLTEESSFSDSSTSTESYYVPSVIPLESDYSKSSDRSETTASESFANTLTTVSSPSREDIEAGLSDDLYLSLSRPHLPEILPSRALAPDTSVYYTETVVTSTRLRTYTYVVTKLNGLETEVTSSTTVRPRVTTLTLTVPVTTTLAATASPSTDSSVTPVYSPESAVEHEPRDEEEGRRFNLATRVMSNGVEVIVAGPTPALRWENSNPQPTLTLSDAVVMLLPQEKPNEFVTKTCTTTFTYLSTITKDGTTTVSTEQQVVANTATEERHRKPGSETAAVTLEASPTLRTEVFKTTYTYLTLNTDHPNVEDALESSTKVITNTVTAPQHYLDMVLEPSEAPRPETNTYLSTRVLEKTVMLEGQTRVETTSDTITQLIVTESGPPPRPTSVTTTLTALDSTEEAMTGIMKTYYITYTYQNTFFEKGSTVVRTNVATSTDVVFEKAPAKKTIAKPSVINPTPEPIQIFATKTLLTTFTYFTTLLQGGLDGNVTTTVSSRSHVVQNVVTESITPSVLTEFTNALLTSAHHSDPVKNVVTGSTIIFFDEADQIDASATTNYPEATISPELDKGESSSEISGSSVIAELPTDVQQDQPTDQENNGDNGASTISPEQNKRPTTQTGDLQVSNLLNLGSLGINSLSALGPVITAMAGLLQGKSTPARRNDTVPATDSQDVTTQRSPIYIPVAEFADGDIETAESQNIAAHLGNVNHNYIAETRHKVASSLADGIPISPGEVITANSDVIIGKPGKMGPRPPQTLLQKNENIGMKPPPLPVPNIPVHPVLEVVEDDREDSQGQHTHKEILQILPAHQVYEEHQKIPLSAPFGGNQKPPQKLHPVQNKPPKRVNAKNDILENDPLLKPPDRPNVEQYVNPNVNLKAPEWNGGKLRRPWSAKDPLSPPVAVPSYEEVHTEKPISEKPRPPAEDRIRPPWAQKDPLLPDTSIVLQSSEPQTLPSEPIVHQVPHVIDRSTGQPLLVNIQPSQVANVVIPQGGTQALIFGDTNEPHISGQYFDDPSPYPEPEVGPGFVGIEKVEDLPQYANERNPTDYMVPPSLPVNFKPHSQKTISSGRPHAVVSSPPVRFDNPRPQDKIESHLSRPEKRPSDVHLVGGSGGQGHVHTEILVHHRPETVNTRPHGHSGQKFPPRGDFSKVQRPTAIPPRRTELSNPSDPPHQYIFLGKPNSGNEINLSGSWKPDKKPPRIGLTNRPRPSRPGSRPNSNLYNRKPIYNNHRRGPTKPPSFLHRPPSGPTRYPDSSRKPTSVKEIEGISGHRPQINLQDRPPSFSADRTESQTERNEEHLPTGAIEYHNPSDPKIKSDGTRFYGQVSSTAKPSTQGFPLTSSQSGEEGIWQESSAGTSYDSDIGASENVHLQNHFNQPVDTPVMDNGDRNHVYEQNKTTQYKDEGFAMQGVSYGQDYYNTRPYDLPVVQGKPFGVYDSHVDLSTPYGYKRKDGRPDYEIIQGVPNNYGGKVPEFGYKNPSNSKQDDTMDLKPPAIISHGDGNRRPYPRPHNTGRPETKIDNRPDHTNKEIVYEESNHQKVSNEQNTHDYRGEMKYGLRKNSTTQQVNNADRTVTRIHPEYPHILTKPKPQIPGPVTITTGNTSPETHGRPDVRFSMPVEATGIEEDSKTQTERPPSMLVTKPPKGAKIDEKQDDETLETAYQTNFASSNHEDGTYQSTDLHSSTENGEKDSSKDTDFPSRDMRPPPLRPTSQMKNDGEDGLKPPPPPASSDVVGMSPPPLDITTTNRPTDDRFSVNVANEPGLKPPPKYIPLKESVAPSPPGVSMVPPSPKPSISRPFLMEILSQDMIPPPPAPKTTKPLEIATVRPAVAVSGSIQIATAVATSHIPVVQDIESKIPIIHGTVDLPMVVDVPDIFRPLETKKAEHVSIYTVRPFDSRPVSRVSIQPTSLTTTSFVTSTKLRPTLDYIEPSRSSTSHREVQPTRTQSYDVPPNPVKRPEHPVFLESSYDNVLPSMRIEPTESLTHAVGTEKRNEQRPTTIFEETSTASGTEITDRTKPMGSKEEMTTRTTSATEPRKTMEITRGDSATIVTRVNSSITKVTSTAMPERKSPQEDNKQEVKVTKNIVGSVMHEVVRNNDSTTAEMKEKEVTRFTTSTVTRTKTSVQGSPPTTRTLLITHTTTSTSIETVTETFLRPTSVVRTVTSTILQPMTRVPTAYENVEDNDSIFVVMSDQKPPEPGAEEVEAEYGEEEVTRDEQDPAGNEIHRVLAGGVLGAPVAPVQSVTEQCVPECRASKAEICMEVGKEMRCVCRPGFARMFPDRPCKPTYTYTLRVGLDRIGQERVAHEMSLNDTSSATYKRVINPTKDALDRTLMQSDLRDIYRGLKIAGFSPNPAKVDFHVQLSDNANETRLKEVIRKYLVGSNYSLGGTDVYASKDLDMVEALDFDECRSQEDGPHHDCSPHATCFNLRGSYQCSCKEGWADLSENPAYPGRICSQAPLGCASCNNKGHCVTNTNGQEVCECFPWHSGQRCQINLKVLLIALVTTGAILLGLLAVCLGLACFRPSRKRKTGDRRAMIPGVGGDTSSEGSVADLAIPHHVPHVLPPPPPPQMMAPLPPTKRPVRKVSTKPHQPPRKATMIPNAVTPLSDDQRDRSLTVMIPRAKYRSAPQSPQNYSKPAGSTFAADEHKLISYLDSGSHQPGNRRQSISSNKDCKETDLQVVRSPVAPTGALVSAGFQVSATVTRAVDGESTLARSYGETTVEAATKSLRGDFPGDLGSTLARSCGETTIQAPTKLLRVDLGEAGSTLARSCGETTIQPPTKMAAARRNSGKDARDSASEGHTMAERDLGSTLRLQPQHPPLYSPDRTSDRESNFDSL